MIIDFIEREELEKAALARKYPDIYKEIYKDGYHCSFFNDSKSGARWFLKVTKSFFVSIGRVMGRFNFYR